MNSEPCAVVSGKQYRLFLQFEGGDPSISPKGRLSAYQARKERGAVVDMLTTNHSGKAREEGLVTVIEGLQPDNVTARVWVSEVGT